ncbi:hypothetical protein QYE76_003155 [Lolium multiflorum]|uniref:Peptidase C1A papain C-terminal domain-containing protein n=1 Tax=Lolium multiflorum TaxID=4521 RepID=A0AAD8RPW9_LOLMU|nr:hypothetical protein QYE76_003155 [Lolium multiflorum]
MVAMPGLEQRRSWACRSAVVHVFRTLRPQPPTVAGLSPWRCSIVDWVKNKTAVTIDDCNDVPMYSEKSLQKAVSNQPISVAIDGRGREFQLYKSFEILEHGSCPFAWEREMRRNGRFAPMGLVLIAIDDACDLFLGPGRDFQIQWRYGCQGSGCNNLMDKALLDTG